VQFVHELFVDEMRRAHLLDGDQLIGGVQSAQVHL
jgi:hypothetical protein